jgi:membrane-associated protease RseP (regulator of RpoE activity)
MHSSKTQALRGLAAGLLLLPGSALMARPADGSDADKPGAPQTKTVREQVVIINDQGKSTTLDAAAQKVACGYLGVGLLDLTPELRAFFGVPEDTGVLVSKVAPGSPAEKAGIKVGDVLTGVDGKAAASSLDVRQKIRAAEDGAQSSLEIWRNRKVQTLTATLEKRVRQEVDVTPLIFKKDGDQLFLQRNGEDPLPLKLEPGKLIHIERLQGKDQDLEKQMKVLEKRIKDLEHQLERQQQH